MWRNNERNVIHQYIIVIEMDNGITNIAALKWVHSRYVEVTPMRNARGALQKTLFYNNYTMHQTNSLLHSINNHNHQTSAATSTVLSALAWDREDILTYAV